MGLEWVSAIQLGVDVGRWIYNRWFGTPPPPPTPGTLQVPLTGEGQPIPLLYGTRRVPGNVVHTCQFGTKVVLDAAGFWIAYAYRAGWHSIYCLANERPTYGASAQLKRLIIGDRDGSSLTGTTHDPLIVSADNYYGGPGKGGGLKGRIWFLPGGYSQTLPGDWIAAAEAELLTENLGTIPAYRGVVSSVQLAWDTTRGFIVGESPTMEPWAMEIYNPVMIPARTEGFAPIGDGDSNPASVLYNLLVERAGVPAALIDVDSFAAAADVLQQEQLGISIVWPGGRVQDHVREVEALIDGAVRENRLTHLYELVLYRKDYVVGDLPSYGPADVISPPRFTATTWEEMPTTVAVTYLDAQKRHTTRTVTETNGALAEKMAGRVRTVTIDMPGVSNRATAIKLAARELLSIGRPTVALRGLELRRRAHRLRRGDVFRFTWPERGITDMVFRVVRANLGTLERGVITIDAVQDRYDGARSITQPPDSVTEYAGLPMPVLERVVTETPRWIQQRAYDAGAITNVDAQRLYELARAEGADVLWRARLATATDTTIDIGPATFTGTFIVDTDLPRTQGPYDTGGSGLVIRSLDGMTLATATGAEIADGKNLIQIGGEILAFEGFASLGGGLYRLTSVWRGLLDTVPADHLEGDRGYVLPGVRGASAMGRRGIDHGDTVTVYTEAQALGEWTPATESTFDAITTRSRVRLPYPVDNLTINGSQTPATLADDGVALTFATRDRLQASITRPDAAAETPEAGTSFAAVAYKGRGPQAGGAQVVVAAAVASGATVYPLGKAGHGTLEVGVDSALVVALPDGSSPTLGAWQVPTLVVDAPHHRNLVINGRFGSSANWTTVTGAGAFGSGGGSLGGGGTMATPAGSVTTLTIRQDVPVSGYPPGHLRGLLELAAGPTTSDANDTIAVSMVERDAAGATLATHSIAATHPTAWDRYQVDVASLDPALDTVRVDLTAAIASAGDGGDTHADIGVTEVELRVGQFTDQLLLNAEFGSGLTSWTQSVGTWQVLTATLYGSPAYVRPNDGASATLYQDVTPPTGYARNATAVLWCGRMNDAASDTGKVTIQALDAGAPPAVLASATTGDEAMASTNVWSRRYLTLDLPADTATVRVKFEATRVSGTPLNACFSDPRLRIFKALDATVDIDHVLNDPPRLRIPANRAEWVAAFPTVTPPNVAMYAGREIGELGIEPLLEAVGSAAFNGEFVCDEGRADGRRRTSCMDLYGGTVRVAPVGNSFLNFRSTEDWCVAVVYKGGTWQGNEVGLIGRSNAITVGWELYLDAGGVPTANVFGPGGIATVADATSPPPPDCGEMRVAILHYAHATHMLSLITERGLVASDDVSAAGEFRTPDPEQPSGGISASSSALNGQIARIWSWRGTATPTAATLSSLATPWTVDPVAGAAELSPRAGAFATVDGSDADGLMVRTWPKGVVPYVLSDEIGDMAIVAQAAATNLATWDLSSWSTVSGTVARAACPVTGIHEGRTIASASGGGARSPTMALGAAGTIYVTICYVAPDGAGSLVLEDNSGSTVASVSIPQSATATTLETSLAWSGATGGNGKIRVTSGDVARTLTLSPIAYVGTTATAPRVIPGPGSCGAVAPSITVAPTTLANHEGELLVDATCLDAGTFTLARLWNGSNANDNRQVRVNAGTVEGKHATSGASNTSATIAVPTLDLGARYTARLRWARCGLVDGNSSEYTSIRIDNGVDVDTATGRSSTWTASATEATQLDVGHDNGSDVATGHIARVRIRAREPRL